MFLMADKVGFGSWLQKQREDRGWTQSDLGRKSGKDRAVINKIESGGALPAVETFVALAEALNVSPLLLLRQAGLLQNGNSDQVKLDDWENLLTKMTPEDEAELRQIAELKIERRKKDQSVKVLKPKRAG